MGSNLLTREAERLEAVLLTLGVINGEAPVLVLYECPESKIIF